MSTASTYFLRLNNESIGLATKIDEYVPAVVPTSIVNIKYFKLAGPKKYKATKISINVREVFIDLLRVSLTLWFIMTPK